MKQLVAVTLMALAAQGAWANAELAKKNNCLACHGVDYWRDRPGDFGAKALKTRVVGVFPNTSCRRLGA